MGLLQSVARQDLAGVVVGQQCSDGDGDVVSICRYHARVLRGGDDVLVRSVGARHHQWPPAGHGLEGAVRQGVGFAVGASDDDNHVGDAQGLGEIDGGVDVDHHHPFPHPSLREFVDEPGVLAHGSAHHEHAGSGHFGQQGLDGGSNDDGGPCFAFTPTEKSHRLRVVEIEGHRGGLKTVGIDEPRCHPQGERVAATAQHSCCMSGCDEHQLGGPPCGALFCLPLLFRLVVVGQHGPSFVEAQGGDVDHLNHELPASQQGSGGARREKVEADDNIVALGVELPGQGAAEDPEALLEGSAGVGRPRRSFSGDGNAQHARFAHPFDVVEVFALDGEGVDVEPRGKSQQQLLAAHAERRRPRNLRKRTQQHPVLFRAVGESGALRHNSP